MSPKSLFPFFSAGRNGIILWALWPFNLICILAVTTPLLRRYCYVQELSLRPKIDILFTGMWWYKSQPWHAHLDQRSAAIVPCFLSHSRQVGHRSSLTVEESYVRTFYLPRACMLSPHSMLNNSHYLHWQESQFRPHIPVFSVLAQSMPKSTYSSAILLFTCSSNTYNILLHYTHPPSLCL